MVREFYEETGIKSNGMNWRKFDVEAFEHGIIHWFYSEALPITTFKQTTEEPPEIWPVRTIIEQGVGGIKGPSLPLYNVPYLLHKADTFRRNPDQQIPFFSV